MKRDLGMAAALFAVLTWYAVGLSTLFPSGLVPSPEADAATTTALVCATP